MTGEQFKEMIKSFDMTLVGASKLFDTHERTARTWSVNGPPYAVEMVLRLMKAFDMSPEDVLRVMQRKTAAGHLGDRRFRENKQPE